MSEETQSGSEGEQQRLQTAEDIAAIYALPGRTLLVRTEDAAVLRIGTVEEEDAHGVCLLSFSSPDGSARKPPERFEHKQLLQPHDIDNHHQSQQIYIKGRRLLHPTTHGCVIVVELRETLMQLSRTVQARRLRYIDDRWEPDEDTTEYPTNELHPALFFALARKWSYLQPVDPFFDVIAEPIGNNAAIGATAKLIIGGVTVPVTTRLILSDLTAKIEAVTHPSLALIIADLAPELAVRVTVRSDEEGIPWVARYAVIGGVGHSWSFDGGYEQGRLDVVSPYVTVTLAEGRPVFTREVFEGIALEAFTHGLLRREPPLPVHSLMQAGADSIRLDLLGRPALIYVPPRLNDEQHHLTAVLYHGTPFKDAERRALTSVIGYLCGGRANHALTETFDVKKKLQIIYTERGSATKRKSPPVPLDRPTPHATLVVREISALVESMAKIYRGGDGNQARTLDAVLHHYAEGVDSVYPTTRILRLAVAFEALVNLVTLDKDPNELITSKTKFRRLRKLFDHALRQAQDGGTPLLEVDEATRFKKKLDQLNLGSNTTRIAKFWRETNVVRSKATDELIRRLRNDSVHQGFVGDESSQRAMWRNHNDANHLTNIVNRSLLAYLGYRGPVRTADGKRWVHARSGRKYIVPMLSPGPRIEININATAPPFTSIDATAFEGLQKLRRRSDRETKRAEVEQARGDR